MDLRVELRNKSFPANSAVPAAERSEPERSEGDRSAAAGTADADFDSARRPGPQLAAKPRCRTYTADYKRQILN